MIFIRKQQLSLLCQISIKTLPDDFLLLSKQPCGNFNVTGGKTTHDMNGACWDKHFVVEARTILSLPQTPYGRFIRPPISLQSHDTNHIDHHRRHRAVFLLALTFFPDFTLHQQSYLTFKLNRWRGKQNFLSDARTVVSEYWPWIFLPKKFTFVFLQHFSPFLVISTLLSTLSHRRNVAN